MAVIRSEGFPFAFETDACKFCQGKCCTGESGYIWVNLEEISSFARFLNMNRDDFILQYLQKINFRYTLKEVVFESGFACVFFDKDKRQCAVYEIRPQQCRSFPFWEHFKHNKKEVEDECIGILPLQY